VPVHCPATAWTVQAPPRRAHRPPTDVIAWIFLDRQLPVVYNIHATMEYQTTGWRAEKGQTRPTTRAPIMGTGNVSFLSSLFVSFRQDQAGCTRPARQCACGTQEPICTKPYLVSRCSHLAWRLRKTKPNLEKMGDLGRRASQKQAPGTAAPLQKPCAKQSQSARHGGPASLLRARDYVRPAGCAKQTQLAACGLSGEAGIRPRTPAAPRLANSRIAS